MSWGISPNANEKEKLKSEYADFFCKGLIRVVRLVGKPITIYSIWEWNCSTECMN